MSAPALEARGITRRYGDLVAVDGLSFEVRPGEIVGLLGPNGAGKTTAMQLCLHLLYPDAGEARLFGRDPEDPEARRRVGYAPDGSLFPRALTGLRVLQLHAELLDLPPGRALEVAGRLGFLDAARRRCATYSRGQAQRLGLALAILGEPDLLLLDEPTAGLDPAAVAALRELLVAVRERGGAVLLNSHLLSEVERVCDRVLFLKAGRLLGVHEVRSAPASVEIRLANPAQVRVPVPGASLEGDRLRIPIASEHDVPRLVRTVVESGGEVLEVRPATATLEQLYLQLVEGRA